MTAAQRLALETIFQVSMEMPGMPEAMSHLAGKVLDRIEAGIDFDNTYMPSCSFRPVSERKEMIAQMKPVLLEFQEMIEHMYDR